MRAEKEVSKAMKALAAGKPHGLSNDEVLELIRTLGDYRAMACNFADILAASASVLLDRKSTSKSERARQASIVLRALNDLKYETNQRSSGSSRQRDTVIERLQRVVDTAGRGGPEKPLRDGHSHSADMRCCEPCPAYGRVPREPMTYTCAQCGQKHVIGMNHAAAMTLRRECKSCGHKYDVKPTVDLGDGSAVYSSSKDWCPKCGGDVREP